MRLRLPTRPILSLAPPRERERRRGWIEPSRCGGYVERRGVQRHRCLWLRPLQGEDGARVALSTAASRSLGSFSMLPRAACFLAVPRSLCLSVSLSLSLPLPPSLCLSLPLPPRLRLRRLDWDGIRQQSVGQSLVLGLHSSLRIMISARTAPRPHHRTRSPKQKNAVSLTPGCNLQTAGIGAGDKRQNSEQRWTALTRMTKPSCTGGLTTVPAAPSRHSQRQQPDNIGDEV